MEFEFSHFIFLFSFLVLVLLLQKLVTRSKTASNLPPGPRKLPFIGNLHLLFSSDPPHCILRDLSMKYGPVMHLKLGEISTVIVSTSDAAKQVMKTHDVVFGTGPSMFAAGYFFYGQTDIAFAPYGEHWRQMRKTCTLELLSAKRVLSFRSLRVAEFSNLCRWIASNAGSPINLTEKIGLTTYVITTQAAIGNKPNEQALFTSLTKQVIELLEGFSLADLYPSIKLFSRIGGLKKKAERVHRELDRILDNTIDQHKQSTSLKTDEDLLDVLLTYLDDSNSPLAKSVTKAVLFDIFLAGIETSVTAVDWAMAETLKHPTILKTAQDEASFKPERFLEKSTDFKGNDFEFIPFGAGRRICPGMTFGIANVELPLAMLLYHFDWALPNKMKPEELDMTEHFGITVHRKDELHVIPIVRRPMSVE